MQSQYLEQLGEKGGASSRKQQLLFRKIEMLLSDVQTE